MVKMPKSHIQLPGFDAQFWLPAKVDPKRQ